MPFSPVDRLTLLPFPQRWDSGTISLRAVLLPRGDPLAPLMTGVPSVPDGPAFADANVQLKAFLIPSLDRLPDLADVTAEVDLGVATPPDKRVLFETVESQFLIDPTIEATTENPRRAGRLFKKLLVPSYTSAFPFAGPRTPYGVLDDSYACALRRGCGLQRPPGPPPSPNTSWGRVIAQVMRQPLLAEQLGLIYAADLLVPDPGMFSNGGWLFLTLTDTSDYTAHVAARPELLMRFAVRLPALEATAARPLFAAVLFPVSSTPLTGNFDELFAEAADYDDGFGKIVHCAQQTTAEPIGLEQDRRGREGPALAPVRDTGIQLGWDDEQLLIWMNRQITDPSVETRQSPMGVRGYRVDVREQGTAAWASMMQVQADLALNGHDIGLFEGELAVEVSPVQLDNVEEGEYWMPAYFTRWEGRSLVTADTVGLQLSGRSPGGGVGYAPVGDDRVPLRYGQTYEFRIRLGDLSGGGPAPEEDPLNPAPAPVGSCPFRRHVPPREVTFQGVPDPVDPLDPPPSIEIFRPRLAYPAAVFTGAPNAVDQLLADADRINVTGEEDVPAIPDPDVETVEITLQVVSLDFDPINSDPGPPLRDVYTTSRPFPADVSQPIELALAYVDVPDIAGLVAPAVGPLPIPRARGVVLRVQAIGRPDPGLDYFGSQEARRGEAASVALQAAPDDERDLFVPDTPANRFRGLFLQPDEAETGSLLAKIHSAGRGVQAETDAFSLLAAELDLDASGAAGLTLSARPGRRVVFGCSQAVPHVLAPDGSSITFASKADLVLRWLPVIRVGLNRDWTWDGTADPAIGVVRDGVGPVGVIRLPRSLNPVVYEAPLAAGRQPERSTTDLLFFDAVDPKPVPPNHPQELRLSYTLTPQFRHGPAATDPPLTVTVDLPITTPPAQTPKIVGAGIALAPYERAPDYSSTEPRERRLWVEFEKPPENPADTYFGRVLAYAPDPMLARGAAAEPPAEPPLPVDPELLRVIHPGQSDDRAGLAAMQQLLPTTSPRHFLLPLPPGLQEDSRELFGFFVYEFRLGHHQGWSTARGRFGPPLRVTGVQHPNPLLRCLASRTPEELLVSAAYATPVFDGRSLLPATPASDIWIVLYTQVIQIDGAEHRNIQLGRKQGWFQRKKLRDRDEIDLSASVRWSKDEIVAALRSLGLPADNPLSVLAVELLPEAQRVADPIGSDLGRVRILRTSPLVPVPPVCAPSPCPPP
jgi:hypothetical protein